MSSIVGCGEVASIDDVKHSSTRIHISQDPSIKTAGIAYITDTECAIVLKQYPVCLLHEVRHCLEGQWHGDKPSSEDCY
jgi:hypothetical protein